MTGLSYLPPEQDFLEAGRVGADRPDAARAIVIPYGLEASVSYGQGTAAGPAAILAASEQLELFDEELWCEPYRDYGVATLTPQAIPATVPEALNELARITDTVLLQDKFPLILGGEHALTAGALRPFIERFSDLVVLHIDAHADLRDGYQGEHYSHAAAMRRVLDYPGVSIVSVGIRAISQEEADFYEANRNRITIWWAKDQAAWDINRIVAALANRPIYVTFDIDGLDAAQMPATGTPTPGGLCYWQALSLLRKAAQTGRIVGGDVVELAPIKGFHAYDYTAAAIAYKIMSYALSGAGRSQEYSER